MSSVMLALLGVLAGIMATTFEHIAAATNYVVTPLAFLSGTFYSVKDLPPFWHGVTHFNPFFYMIDGFRHGFFGLSDVSPWISLAIVGTSFVGVSALTLRLLKSGYKLRT
jgi:ABC-2 type transport system permease protein